MQMAPPDKIPGDHRTSPLKARLLAPFSAKYRNRLALLDQSPAWQVAHNYSVLSHDRKLLFIKTPRPAALLPSSTSYGCATVNLSKTPSH